MLGVLNDGEKGAEIKSLWLESGYRLPFGD